MTDNTPKTNSNSRRSFLTNATAIATTTALANKLGTDVHAQESSGTGKTGLTNGIVGAGGRGTGALNDSLSINENVRVIAVADVSRTKGERPASSLRETMTRTTYLLTLLLLLPGVRNLDAQEAPSIKTWVYQLQNYKQGRLDEIASTNFDLAVIDLARDGSDEFFTSDEITAVKSTGKVVFSYFEIGAIEDFRPEWKLIPEDLKAGEVDGWENEQYVKYWDERWWPIVKGRVDQSLKAGFDGAYLDLINAYEEIPDTGLDDEERAKRMVDLISRISEYAKSKNAKYKIIAQNCPELYTWAFWEPKPNEQYINAIDGVAIESVFYIAHDKPANKGWCKENRDNAIAIKNAGKLLLGVDYAKKQTSIQDSYKKQSELGFVPYVTHVKLNHIAERKNE